MKSGNKPGFKKMGSSPALNMKDSSYESPAKQYKQPTGPRAEVKPEELRKVPMTNKEWNKDDSIQTRISEGSIETQALRRKENKKQAKMKSPIKQRSTKGGEGKDQNKIFDENGKHIGDYVNGKKVMKSTTSAHGQLEDAERDFKRDMDRARPNKAKDKALNKMLNKKSPAKQTKFPNSSKALKRKQRDFVPAYPGGDYSKKDIAKMTEKQKAQKIDGYTPQKKSPAKMSCGCGGDKKKNEKS